MLKGIKRRLVRVGVELVLTLPTSHRRAPGYGKENEGGARPGPGSLPLPFPRPAPTFFLTRSPGAETLSSPGPGAVTKKRR